MKSKMHKYLLTDILAIILVSVMVFAADFFDEKEIIFPEMAALSVGYLVAQKRSWMVNGRRMLLLITGCAFMGVIIVRKLSIGVFPELLIAFLLSQILFLYSGTTFAPFVSAIVLPVMLQTTTWVYPISAFILTSLLVIFHKLLIKMGVRENEDYKPVLLSSKEDWKDLLLRFIIVAIVGGICFSHGYRFVIAPPILVAFTEFSRPRNKTRNKPVKTIILVTYCGFVGFLVRAFLIIKLGIPTFAGAAIIMILTLLMIHIFHMYMPPAGAIAILSLIIPEDMLIIYPILVSVGITIFMICSRILFMRRQENMEINDHELNAE
ncbi:MAG: hypothetical protein K6E10_06595 [Eubacterium sp.]|nr:hypothetical protein [Eubacterium sp.]